MSRKAAAGAVVWLCLAAASRLHMAPLNTIELLFLLGPLVVVPFGLELYIQLNREKGIGFPFRIAQQIQFPAALSAVASFWLPRGVQPMLLALPWFAVGCLVGLESLLAAFRGEFRKLKSACGIVSFLYLPVGCAWLMASCLGLTPMGFQEPIVLLTAVHFHFAGFAAPLLAMAAGSSVEKRGATFRKVFKIVAAGVLIGPGMLAAGFVIGPGFKLAGALVVACSEAGLSLFFLALLGGMRPRLAQVFIALSAVSVLFSMVLAGVWAIGEFPLQPFVHLDEMARLHGTANAFGFILCALVGWTITARQRVRLNGDLQ